MFKIFKKREEREKLDISTNWEDLSPEDQLITPKEDETKYAQKIAKDEEGKGKMTQIIGEKYAIRGNPTRPALLALNPIKALVDKLIGSKLPSLIIHERPNSELSRPVREVARVFDLLIEAEKLESNQQRWRNYKKVIIFFLDNDIAYRYRWQWFMERLDMSKIKLDKGDKYFFRIKNFRVELEEDWNDLVKKFPQLKDQEVAKEFKKVLYDEKRSDTCYGDKSKPEDLAREFLKL